MGLRHAIGDVTAISDGIWRTQLAPADVRRIGEGKSSFGARSVVCVQRPDFDVRGSTLSVEPEATMVLNIGTSNEVLLLDLGIDETPDLPPVPSAKVNSGNVEAIVQPGQGDKAFLAECEQLLDAQLVGMARKLLAELRGRYPGELHEGLARKWVNHPGNFLAIVIQNRDQSFAIHIKGEPRRFQAPSLTIKPDRPSYSRFKLKHLSEFDDALRVILLSAQRSEGY